jgi:hypothetical protein
MDPIQTPTPPLKKPSRLKRFLKLLFFFIFILLFLVIGAGAVVAWKYEDEAKAMVISKLNEQLNTEVIVSPKDIDFSVLRNFPNASVDFKNVKMLDAVQSDAPKDTLFKAGTISLQFNIRDIFNKHYVIKRIAISDVLMKVWVDKKGKDNFHFLKSSADTSSIRDTTAFALDKIQLSNVRLKYINHQTKDDDDLTIQSMDLKGQFSSREYTITTDLKMFVTHISNGTTAYIKNRNVSLNTDLDVKGTKYAIHKGEIKLGTLALTLTGTIDHHDSSDVVHLNLGGKNMDIQAACSWAPGRFKKDIAEFDSKGIFYFIASINGKLSKKSSPVITASFGVTNGEVRQTKENLTAKKVEIKGVYTSAGKGQLNITTFSGVLPEGNLKGNFKIDNFSNPLLNAKVEGIVNLEELQKFLRIDTIESIKGNMKLNATFAGHIKKDASGYLSEDKTSGLISLSDVSLRLRKNNLHFNDFSGTLSLADNNIEVKAFKGKVSNSDFNIDGTFKNMLAFLLLKDEHLTADITLSSKKIDLNDLLNDKSNPPSKANPTYKLNLSKYLDLTLHSQIDRLIFRKFEATEIRGVLLLKDKHLSVDPLSFRTMDGTISTKSDLDGTRGDSVFIRSEANLVGINVTKMFSEFENFGQSTLVDKNIKGTLTASVQMAVPCGIDLSMNTAKLIVKSDITILNGELIKLASLKSMSKFVSMKELEDIRFETLTSGIGIRNRIISFPETQINSNAMDIEVSGTQDFDGNVDYVFGLYLSEILAKKAKANKQENSDFAEQDTEDNHRLRIFLSMKGPIDNPKIKYDHKVAQEERKAKRKDEKENIKGLLNEEFGMFKHDSLAIQRKNDKKKKKSDDKFSVKFDEEEKKKKEEKKDDGDF